jgi:hypothetical protein
MTARNAQREFRPTENFWQRGTHGRNANNVPVNVREPPGTIDIYSLTMRIVHQ